MKRKSNQSDHKMRDFRIPRKERADQCQRTTGNAATASSRDLSRTPPGKGNPEGERVQKRGLVYRRAALKHSSKLTQCRVSEQYAIPGDN